MATRSPLVAALILAFCRIGSADGAAAPDSLYSRLGGRAMRAHGVPLAARNELLEALASRRHAA